MSLRGVARETLDIIESGRYQSLSGAWVDVGDAVKAAVAGTVLYRPGGLDLSAASPGAPNIEVTEETTQAAARRLIADEGVADLVLLNYASARNPGGGFLGGAKAQEEDLCRCSGLYACLLTQPEYYEANRAQSSMLYTDHIIYAPRVPFFRDGRRGLMESPVLSSVITAPAPNAGEHLRRSPAETAVLEETLHRRAGLVLLVARAQQHRTLLLGAWGCGVFRNDPHRVAEAFMSWLAVLGGAFDRVVFAVPAGKPAHNLEAFTIRCASRW